MSRLEIALLGPPEIKIDNHPVQTDRRKAIALLAYLAVTGKPHTRDHLAGFLWPDYERDSAYAYLRRTLWELNQILGKGWIDADRERVVLAQTPDLWLDTAAFQELTHAGPGGVADLTRAVQCYRGDFLAGFTVADTAPFEDWQFQQTEHFRREFARALESLVEFHTQAGEHEPALPHARRWLALDPLNETAYRAIMRLLAGMGDRTGAIRQYETCAQTLQDELSIPPQPETTKLYEAILRGDIRAASFDTGQKPPVAQGATSPELVTSPEPVQSRPAPRLPVMLTPFIGRRPEVEEVKALILNPVNRMVNLIGPGGTGKTRLSIQAASEVVDAFPDGIYFAALAPVQTAEAVLPAIAKAVDFSFYKEESRQQQLLDFLREKRLLLILDNFEHLQEAASLVRDILTNAPDVKLIVTSRVRLNVRGEQVYPVRGMRTPKIEEVSGWDDPETQVKPFSGMQLFLDCARRVRPDFALTQENLASVVEICQLVQGMPLGLELASAWLELLRPDEIAQEIHRSLDFLETDQDDVPDRQRSIRAVFESSWKLLNEGEREAFQRLCVFVGSFSREAAQAVSGASLRTLLGLANKSWLQQTEEGRFQLHELMRQYGEERLNADLAAWKDIKSRHADYFADFAAEQSERMKGPEQRTGIYALELEFNTNLRAAWDWLVSEKRWNVIVDQMLTGLFQLTRVRGRSYELLPWLQHARFSMAASPEDRLAFAILGTVEVDGKEVIRLIDADHRDRLAHLWELSREHGLAEAMGLWFVLLAGPVWRRNLDPDAERLLKEAVDQLREPGKEWELGWGLLGPLNAWGLFASLEEDKLRQAGARLLEAEKIFQTLGTPFEQGQIAVLRGVLAMRQNRTVTEVETHFQKARDFYLALGDHFYDPLENLAAYYLKYGETEKAFALFREQQREYERVGNIWDLGGNLYWESIHAVRYSIRDHAVAAQQRNIGILKKLGLDEAYPGNFAWPVYELGEAYRVFGETDKAIEHFERARVVFERGQMIQGLGYYQRSQGDMALKAGRYSEALDHYKKYNEYFVRQKNPWALAQSYGKLALAHAYLGDLGAARAEMRESLALSHTISQFALELIALLAEPVCLIKEGNQERAIELTAFIVHHPVSWNETRWQAQEILDWAAQGLSEESVQAAIERGKALDLETVVKQVLQV